MMCSVCKHVLTLTVRYEDVVLAEEEEPVAQVQIPTWKHPANRTFDHDPMPVPTVDADAAEICDFCSTPEVVGYAMATPFKVVHHGSEYRDDGTWACCSTCRGLLEANKGNRLLRRSIEILTAKHGPTAAESITAIQQAFLHHRTGEIVDRHTLT